MNDVRIIMEIRHGSGGVSKKIGCLKNSKSTKILLLYTYLTDVTPVNQIDPK